ncbi:sterol desaturase family protein [Geobacter sp.]|uniref:sterol desaturase family protein n=1 Tax=Geobacter sp. TaxID=46610 RepID=UPI00261C755A|nr:sterol desaturase family protein [Geobacter sp.]
MEGEVAIRLGFFFGVLAAVAAWEVIAPRRPLTDRKGRRWFANLSLAAIDTSLARLALPVLPLDMAMRAREGGWGILNAFVLPQWVGIVVAVIVLDLVIYLQHVLFHFLPIFWRLHRMHHTDLDVDVTTGNRFHPLEIIVSQGIKLAAVALLGAPVTAVIAFEVTLNATSMFNHGNIRIPPALDRWLRLVVVTPDMHRVHHSIVPHETNSNFGFNLPWWDRLAGTYRPQPEGGHGGMTIGLKEFRSPEMLTLPRLLVQPFRSP